MAETELYPRTKKYALRIIRLYVALPKTTEARVLGKQVLRSGTSIGAHYSEANRGKSDADFINKLQTALQELDAKVRPLLQETKELNAIITTIIKKVRAKK